MKMFALPLLIGQLVLAGSAVAAVNTSTQHGTVLDISSKIYVDGKLTSSPRIITFVNQKASIYLSDKDHSFTMDVIGNDYKKDSLKMNLVIKYQEGKLTDSSKPTLYVKSKQEASIAYKTPSGHDYKIVMITEKKKI